MRLGELLQESAIISAKQLDEALFYGKAKALPLGRCLKILRYLSEENLARALEAQNLIRKGTMDAPTAVDVLRHAHRNNITLHEALFVCSKTGNELRKMTSDKGIAKVAVGVNFPTIAPLAVVGKDYRQPVDSIIPEPNTTSEELLAEGDRLLADDRCADAEKSYKAARDLLIAKFGGVHEKVAAAGTKLANLYLSLDRFLEAEQLYKQVLDIYSQSAGARSLLVAKAMEDLGDLRMVQDSFDAAEGFFDGAFVIAEQQSEIDTAVVGRLLNKLAGAARGLEQTGKREAASNKRIGEYCLDAGFISAERLQQALQSSKQTGRQLGDILRTEKYLTPQQLDGTLFAQMLTKQAMVPYVVAVRALAVAGKSGLALRQIAESGRLISESQSAEEQYRQMALEHERLMAAETSLGADHPEVAAIAVRLADLVIARGDRQSASVLLKRALTILQKTPGSDKLLLAGIAEKLASLLIDESKYMEAQPLLLKALEMRQSTGASESAAAVGCLALLGQVEAVQQNFGPAVSFYRAAVALHDKLHPAECPHELLQRVADCFANAAMYADAESVYKRLITWAQTNFGPFEPESAAYMEQLGDLLVSAGQKKQAEAQYYFAMQILERSLASAAQVGKLQQKLTACSAV